MSIRSAKEELRSQLRESVDGLATEAVQVERIHCSFRRMPNAATLHARYDLSGPAAQGEGILVLESIGRHHPRTVISAVNASVTWGPHDRRAGREAPAIAVIEPNAGFSWNQVELSVECEATPEAVGSEVMLLPEYLPLPVQLADISRIAVPLIRLTFDRSVAPMVGGGIPFDPALPWDPGVGESCQAALLLDDSGEGALSEDLRTRIVKLVGTLGTYLGRPVEAPLFIIRSTPEGATRLAGFVIDEERFGGLTAGTMADYAQLLEHLGGIWWGGGCRIAGPQGEKIESAIRLAVMMHLACRSAISSDAREEILRDFEEDPDLVLAAGLCRHLGAGSLEGLGPLRRLTSISWGKCVPERAVLEALAPSLNSLR